MSPSLERRIYEYAVAHRHQMRWKRRLYMMLYGCNSLVLLSRIR